MMDRRVHEETGGDPDCPHKWTETHKNVVYTAVLTEEPGEWPKRAAYPYGHMFKCLDCGREFRYASMEE